MLVFVIPVQVVSIIRERVLCLRCHGDDVTGAASAAGTHQSEPDDG